MWRISLVALALLGASCRKTAAPAFDPVIAACVPPTATMLAGVDLDRLRASPLSRNLPSATRSLLDPLRGASQLVVALDGPSVVAIARGNFREPPAGAELVAPGIAMLAPPAAIAAAKSRVAARTPGAPGLISYAEPVASNPVWAAALGSATLPLTGNLANVNNFLHMTVYTTAAGQLGDRLSLDLTGVCSTPADAERLEGTVRALISLATLRGSTADIKLERRDSTVRVSLSADAVAVEKLLR